MKLGAPDLLRALAIGLSATLFMDAWALFAKRFFDVPASNYCLVGRWVCHMPEGTFVHTSIVTAASKRFECAVGWIAHYVVGAGYGLVFVALVSSAWLAHPKLLSALLFGIASVLVPFLIMQPSFGLGIAAAKTPRPAQARLRSLMAHTAFGIGLYISAAGANYLLPVQ
jgi:hypothetical protein